MFSEIERTVQVIESELIGDWQNVYLLAPSPDGTISNPSTKIARQCHSAEWRERIFFPLSFAFFALALLATVLFCEQMLAFLFALRAVCAARWLAPSSYQDTWMKAMRLFCGVGQGQGAGRGAPKRPCTCRSAAPLAAADPRRPGRPARPCPGGAPIEKMAGFAGL